MNVWFLVVAALLILANGVFVAMEFSLVASRATKLETLAADGTMRARFARDMTGEVSLQLAGTQLGVTMTSLLLGAVAEPTLTEPFRDLFDRAGSWPAGLREALAVVLGLAIVAFFHTVFGEMVPKYLALADPESTLLRLSVVNRVYITVFRPVIRVLSRAANAGVRLLGVEPREELASVHTAAEIANMLGASRDQGLVEESEHDLLAGALDFGESTASEVMVPRARIDAVPRRTTVADAEQVFVQSGHSRLLVIGDDLDDVVGFIHAKELLTVKASARSRPIPISRIREVMVVAPQVALDDVLVGMRRSRTHVAVVREQGETVGLLTLEDVLEDLVGDIRDETDRAPRR